MSNSTTSTTSTTFWDVIIIGAGVSGPTAGIYLAHAGRRVLLLDGGKSSIKQCAFLENYPGFPAGIGIPTFLKLLHTQATNAGCTLRQDPVTALRRGPEELYVETRGGEVLRAPRILVATVYETGYLQTLPEEERAHLLDEHGLVRHEAVDAHGHCGIEGLYIASPLVGYESQAVISAGFGARVALGILREDFEAEGAWPALARTVDWRVYAGTYGTADWDAAIDDYYRGTVPHDSDLDEAAITRLIQQKQQQMLDWELPKREARRLAKKAQLALLDQLDPELIADYCRHHSNTID